MFNSELQQIGGNSSITTNCTVWGALQSLFTHHPQVPHICATELGHRWVREWFVVYSAQSPFLDQWLPLHHDPRDKLQWNNYCSNSIHVNYRHYDPIINVNCDINHIHPFISIYPHCYYQSQHPVHNVTGKMDGMVYINLWRAILDNTWNTLHTFVYSNPLYKHTFVCPCH